MAKITELFGKEKLVEKWVQLGYSEETIMREVFKDAKFWVKVFWSLDDIKTNILENVTWAQRSALRVWWLFNRPIKEVVFEAFINKELNDSIYLHILRRSIWKYIRQMKNWTLEQIIIVAE